jgi:hypothetical protein
MPKTYSGYILGTSPSLRDMNDDTDYFVSASAKLELSDKSVRIEISYMDVQG